MTAPITLRNADRLQHVAVSRLHRRMAALEAAVRAKAFIVMVDAARLDALGMAVAQLQAMAASGVDDGK